MPHRGCAPRRASPRWIGALGIDAISWGHSCPGGLIQDVTRVESPRVRVRKSPELLPVVLMGVCLPRDSPGYPVIDGAPFSREARYRGSAHLHPDDLCLLTPLADVRTRTLKAAPSPSARASTTASTVTRSKIKLSAIWGSVSTQGRTASLDADPTALRRERVPRRFA